MRTYELIRSRRKTLALELTREGRLLVRAPMRTSQAQIDAFVAAHEDWIARHLAQLASVPPVSVPTTEELAALKARAQAVLPRIVADWSARMDLHPTGVKITAAKKRYGSCNSRGGLCFSCYLMRCPEAAIELVVVHELCHLREMNHGPAFYALLEAWLPDWRARKKLLK